MIKLTDHQLDIKDRITESIDFEINMCDDYKDLIILASILYESSKTIFNTYADKFGKENLEKAIAECK
jgi:hypothetical protein